MNLDYMKLMAQTGDVALVRGHSAEQMGIQVATASSFCHIAQLLRDPLGGLLVCEMMEPHGYQSFTFDDWLTTRSADDEVYFGQAPDAVRKGAAAITARQAEYADKAKQHYCFAALPLVWLSGITGKEYPTGGEVCSLLVADNWEAAGYQIDGNPSPGTFLKLCESVSFVRR